MTSNMATKTLSKLQAHDIMPVQLNDPTFPYGDGDGTGLVFVHDKYLGEKGLIANRLELRGYAWPVVTGEVEVDRDARTADIGIDVVPLSRKQSGDVSVEK